MNRPSKGRPGRVSKPAAPPRRRLQPQLLAAATSSANTLLHPEIQLGIASDGLKVASPDQGHRMAGDLVDGEAEAEGEVDDDIAHLTHQHSSHQSATNEFDPASGTFTNGLMDSDSDPTASVFMQPLVPSPAGSRMDGYGLHSLAGPPPAPLPKQTTSTENVAADSGYTNLAIESALARRLAREPGVRPARQRRPEQQLNLTRRSNVEALFAHIAGEEIRPPCANCRKGHGPWTLCVVVDGQMCGSCANCWFNASGARCSFHGTYLVDTTTRLLWQVQFADTSFRLAETKAPPPTRHANIQNPHHTSHQQVVLAPGPPSLPDGNHQYDLATAMLHQPSGPGQAGSSNAVGGDAHTSVQLPTPFISVNPTVRYVVEQALAEARGSDRRARQLIKVEIAAKQLALRIAEYEDAVAGDHNPAQDGTSDLDDSGAS